LWSIGDLGTKIHHGKKKARCNDQETPIICVSYEKRSGCGDCRGNQEPQSKGRHARHSIAVVLNISPVLRKVNLGLTGLVRAEFDSVPKTDEHAIMLFIDPCRDAEIDETITVEIMLFPAGRESMIQTVPVNVYRFYKQGEQLRKES
jgi:hypothetical protein